MLRFPGSRVCCIIYTRFRLELVAKDCVGVIYFWSSLCGRRQRAKRLIGLCSEQWCGSVTATVGSMESRGYGDVDVREAMIANAKYAIDIRVHACERQIIT